MLAFMLFLGMTDPAKAAFLDAQKLAEERKFTEAAAMYSTALKHNPDYALAQDRRGDCYLKLGKFTDAITDFDAFLAVEPPFAVDHWRRGIALYYAGKHKDGVAQFQQHKTVNPQDVENAAWHYACNVVVVGKPKAIQDLITVTNDRRVAMAEIQQLFAGKIQPPAVFEAAEATDMKTDAGKQARFYAHLYVGLWYETEKQAEKSLSHMKQAEGFPISHYMYDIAVMHAKLRSPQKK
jgi:lipoprotein NlpI